MPTNSPFSTLKEKLLSARVATLPRPPYTLLRLMACKTVMARSSLTTF